ncbi:MAG: CopG family transcriptional regulator [Propionibacteriaceae bacterium]
MDLSPYIESVRHGVTNAAALADDNTQQVASRLGTAIESSTRLALIQALSDAAGTISAELAPASVEVRMTGQDPDFVVSVPHPSSEPTLLLPEPETSPEEPELDEEPLARISLRLPNSVKVRVDELADKDGISTNSWLIRAVVDALAERRRSDGPPPPQPPTPPLGGGVFGPNGPFGPNGIFGNGGPFAPGRPERTRGHDRGPHEGGGPSGGVQGWVR